MNSLAQIEWRQPAWWLLALLPLVFVLWERRRRQTQLAYAEPQLLPWAVSQHAAAARSHWRRAAYFLAWCLLAGAAAGPRLPLTMPTGLGSQDHQGNVSRQNTDLVIALDISNAMLATSPTSRQLDPVKLALLDLLERLRGERLGLVVFAKGAGLLMPLSDDYAAFRYYLNLADSGLLEGTGQGSGGEINAALDLALASLSNAKNRAAKAILLVTDSSEADLSGERGLQLRSAADRLKQAGVRLYVLELGTRADATLEDLASTTGGLLDQLGNGAAPWGQLYEKGWLTLAGQTAGTTLPRAWQELYAWLLVPATALFWLLSLPPVWLLGRASRIPGLAAVFLLGGLVWAPQPAQAADATLNRAYAAYRKGDYSVAQTLYSQLQGYHALMGEGAAVYRRRQYAFAVNRYTAALLTAQQPSQRADALFNLGNSYFFTGNIQAAADAYAGVLRYRPQDPGALTNLALAQQKLGAMAPLDSYSAGILARGASRNESGYAKDNGKLPPVETVSEALGPQAPRPQDEAAQQGVLVPGSRMDTQAASAARLRPEQYHAAQKKLELVDDTPQTLQKTLMNLQAAQGQRTGGVP